MSGLNFSFCSHELVVGSLVVNVIKRRHETDLHAAEFAFENTEIVPRMVWLVLWPDTPKVVPLAAYRSGPAHDFEVKEIRRHDVSIGHIRTAKEIRGLLAEMHNDRRRDPAAL